MDKDFVNCGSFPLKSLSNNANNAYVCAYRVRLCNGVAMKVFNC